MITVYHLDNSRSERIVWLMEELGAPYEQQTFLRDHGASPAALREIHPLGKAPLIRDGDIVVMESGAIVDYILRRRGDGKLQPPVDSADFARFLEYLHYAEGSCISGLLNEFMARRAAGADPDASPAVQALVKRNRTMLQFLNDELGKRPYFAGAEFSAADIMMEFSLAFQERTVKQDFADTHPHIDAWLKRVRARPGYQRAMAVAAPQVPL